MAYTESQAPESLASVVDENPRMRGIATWTVAGAVPLLAGLVVLMFSDVTATWQVLAGIIGMLLMMLLRIPVGFALGMVGVLGLWSIAGIDGALNAVQRSPWTTSSSWILSVIPMFVLMGVLLERSGVTQNIFRGAQGLVGNLPAGMAISTNFAGAALGAASGSTLGITYALGRIALPEMKRLGYDNRLAAGAVLMAGTGGQLLPPSITLVIYAGIAQVPVGQQLLAGVAPGIILALSYAVVMLIIGIVRPEYAPRPAGSLLLAQVVRSGLSIWPVMLLVVVVLGGIYQGVFTATEAGAYGVLTAMLVVVIQRGPARFLRALPAALRDTLVATGSVFLLLIAGTVFARYLTLSGVPREVTHWIEGINAGPVQFMLMMMVVYILMGMFMDPVAMMLVTVPIVLPVAVAVGVDPLVFGIFVVLLGELAVLTPPVGILVYVLHGIGKSTETDLTLAEAFRGVSWFYPITLAVAFSMVLFPDLMLWLPRMS